MAFLSRDEKEKKRLNYFTSNEGREDLHNFGKREHRTLFEVLESFHSSIPPLESIIEHVPFLKPRQFSISSSKFESKNSIEITAVYVNYKTPYKRQKTGVCSDFLDRLDPGRKVLISVSEGSFKKPSDWISKPLIAIGPGTGLAPLKSMVEERNFLIIREKSIEKSPKKSKLVGKRRFGEVALFLGHRNVDGDFLYAFEKWDKFKEALCHISVAFSRDQKEKHYVQDHLVAHGDLVWKLLEREANIVISGNAKQMPSDVKDALISVIKENGNFNEVKANEYIKDMIRTGRYQMEVW